jgi:hypothetical protein
MAKPRLTALGKKEPYGGEDAPKQASDDHASHQQPQRPVYNLGQFLHVASSI